MDENRREPSTHSAGGRRQKAEILDAFVRESLEKRYAEQTAKMNKLRNLRLARDAAERLTAAAPVPRRRKAKSA
jgi:hypothetical protein